MGKPGPGRRGGAHVCPEGTDPQAVTDSHVRERSYFSSELRGFPESPHAAGGERTSPLLLQRGPERQPGGRSAGEPGRKLAWGEDRGEDAGPGGRGLGLCRPVDPTPSSRPQRPSPQLPSVSEFGVRRVPDGLPGAGSGRRLCAPRSTQPKLWVSLRRHPPGKSTAPPDLGSRAPNPALEGLHDAWRARQPPGHPRAASVQAEGQRWGRGRCGDQSLPTRAPLPSGAQELRAEKLRHAPTPRPRGPAPLRLGYLRSARRASGEWRGARGAGRGARGGGRCQPLAAGRALPHGRARAAAWTLGP